MEPLASLNVWAEVSKYIIENDMEKAGILSYLGVFLLFQMNARRE
jgi:hypothetical protein